MSGHHFDKATKGQTVGALMLPAPGTDGPEAGVDAGVADLFAAKARQVGALGGALQACMGRWEALLRQVAP